MRGISKSNTNGLKTSHGGKSFTKVNTFDLGKTLSHQPCLVPDDNTKCILLVLENPLGPNNIMITFGSLHYCPHLVALEVIEFIMHGLKPIRIFKRLTYLLGFNTRNKCIMGTKVSQLTTSCYPLLDASEHLIHRKIL